MGPAANPDAHAAPPACAPLMAAAVPNPATAPPKAAPGRAAPVSYTHLRAHET